ncbi:hypothetical protein BGZ83_006030 [Gryganskiella cystojenkinii]|nr:hypothetical protein BGZ83_006030 [Gryganskiella cystojenkinii]
MDPHTSTAPQKKPKPTTTKAPPQPHIPSSSKGGPGGDATATSIQSISPTPTSPNNGQDSSSSSKALSTPAIAGIAAAGGVILLFIISVIICKRRRAERYARRDHEKHDPSRDPINPNDVLPPLVRKPQFEDIDLAAYPLAVRVGGGGGVEGGARAEGGPGLSHDQPHSLPSQPALHQVYPQYEEHVQSHFGGSDKSVLPVQVNGPVTGPGGAGFMPSPNFSHASMERNRVAPSGESRGSSGSGTPGGQAPMSPSQRAQQSPRSPRSRPGQGGGDLEPVMINDMGNQFVMQPSTPTSIHGSSRPSVDQEGSIVYSDHGHGQGQGQRRPVPRKSQDSNSGRVGGGGPGRANPYPGPQQGSYSSPPLEPQNRGGPGGNVSSRSSPHPRPFAQDGPVPASGQPHMHPQARPYPQQQQQQQQQYQQPYMYPQNRQGPPMGPSVGPRHDNSHSYNPRAPY